MTSPGLAGASPAERLISRAGVSLAPGALPPVTVALPIHKPEPDRLARALASITAQTHSTLEILLIPNGCSPAELLLIGDLARHDPRCRVTPLPDASLAAALNHALRVATHALIARQDADDVSTPDRIEQQARAIADRPRLAALGCGWTTIDRATSRATSTTRPPTDPRDARAALLTTNPFAHGSMMLRRDAIRAVGGYDESLERAQDYELWTRLARLHQIAAIPDVLYHWTHHGHASHSSSPAQARTHARAMLRAWDQLDAPAHDPSAPELAASARAELESAITRVLIGDATPDVLDHVLRTHPSSTALLARLWADRVQPPEAGRAIEACRRAKLREVGARLRARGIDSVHLYPGGAHAAWVADHADDLGLAIASWRDDNPATGHASPEALTAGEHVLICSDHLEDLLWERTADLRRRGVHVHRLYADSDDEAVTAQTHHEASASPSLARTA